MNRLLFWPTLLLVTGGLLGVYLGGRPKPIDTTIEEHRSILISRISEVAELTTLKVPVSQVMTSELNGYVGGISCIVVVNGEVALGVDLEQARIEEVDPDARTATLVLPAPKVLYARLDHERTKFYSINRQGLWWLAWGDDASRKLINNVMGEAQEVVEDVSDDVQFRRQARGRTENILAAAFEKLGWRIVMVWPEQHR